MLTVNLLGPPQVSLNQRPLSLRRRKSRALLYYLAAHPQTFSRDHLAALLWPEVDRAAAQQSLRTALYELRKALDTALNLTDDGLSLAPGAEVDALEFEQRLASAPTDPASLTAALALYRGDFLQGFNLPDAPAFDDWQTAAQERYRRLAVRGLTLLSRQHDLNHDYAAALDALSRALDLDPLQEDLQRAALRLHYLAGDRAGAIRRYEALRQLLDREMGVPPMAETRALYDLIVNEAPLPDSPAPAPPVAEQSLSPAASPVAPSAAAAPTLPFSGRAAELQTLQAAAAERCLAVIEGPAGMGKTRLAQEFLRATGALVLRGAARELEQGLPYQPVIDALRGLIAGPDWPAISARLDLLPVWLAEAARLLPELAATAGPPPPARFVTGAEAAVTVDESRLWEGVYQFLAAVARPHPLALFLDDLHWADVSTLGLLAYLVRRGQTTDPSLLFVATAQPAAPRSPLARLLQTLTRENRLTLLRLDRLSPPDIAAIAHEICSAHADVLAEWLERTSEGNPYILVEMVRHARSAGMLLPDGTVNIHWLTGEASSAIPRSVYSLIQSRLDRLSEGARRIVDAGVAAGREFEFAVVARAAGLSEAAALDALAEVRAAALIQPAGETRYAFDHSLTMEVAYREIDEARHRLMHRRVAEATESIYRHRLDSVAGVLAFHFDEGGLPDRAAPYAFRAGQLAANLAAWTEATGFYELALRAEADPARRAHTLIALGEAQQPMGKLAEATMNFRQALELAQANADSASVEAARLGLIVALIPQGRFAEVLDLVNQMRAKGGPRNQVLAERLLALALMLEGAELPEALTHLQNARRLLQEQPNPDPAYMAQIEFEIGNVQAELGDLPAAVDSYRSALAVAASADGPNALHWQVLAHNNLAYHLHLIDPRHPEAEPQALAGLQLARERGALGEMPFLLSTLGELALARADLPAAERYFNEGLTLAEQIGVPDRVAGITANLGLVAAQRGETTLAVHRLTTALDHAEALGEQHLMARIHLWLAPLLPVAEGRSHLAAARAIAKRSGRGLLLTEVARLEAELPAS